MGVRPPRMPSRVPPTRARRPATSLFRLVRTDERRGFRDRLLAEISLDASREQGLQDGAEQTANNRHLLHNNLDRVEDSSDGLEDLGDLGGEVLGQVALGDGALAEEAAGEARV
jgi:hypothetical protein